MYPAITDTTDNTGGMVTRHPGTRGLPLILPLNTPIMWNHHVGFHLQPFG